jgi:predicted translin family RNA/ssDNA-binding protein
MANLGEYFGRVTYTAIHLKEGALAEKKSDREEILRVARKEHANAKAALELVKRDSRLGWEPSMDYLGGAEQIEWKLKRMETLYNFDK